jgi:hypothetical protein
MDKSDTTKRLMSSSKCRSVEVINNPVRPGSNHREVNCTTTTTTTTTIIIKRDLRYDIDNNNNSNNNNNNKESFEM